MPGFTHYNLIRTRFYTSSKVSGSVSSAWQLNHDFVFATLWDRVLSSSTTMKVTLYSTISVSIYTISRMQCVAQGIIYYAVYFHAAGDAN